MPIFEVRRDVEYTQAKGCVFCLHVGATAFYFGSGRQGWGGPRLELFTPLHWFRWSRGYTEVRQHADL